MVDRFQSLVLLVSKGSFYFAIGTLLAFGTLLAVDGWESLKTRHLLETTLLVIGISIGRILVLTCMYFDALASVRQWVLKRKLRDLDTLVAHELTTLANQFEAGRITKKLQNDETRWLLRQRRLAGWQLVKQSHGLIFQQEKDSPENEKDSPLPKVRGRNKTAES